MDPALLADSARTCLIRGSVFGYHEVGSGLPLLALSGSPADARQTIGALEPVFGDRSGWRRIHLDLPGQGRTPAPEWVRTHVDVLQAVREFLDEVVGYLVRALVAEWLDRVEESVRSGSGLPG